MVASDTGKTAVHAAHFIYAPLCCIFGAGSQADRGHAELPGDWCYHHRLPTQLEVG